MAAPNSNIDTMRRSTRVRTEIPVRLRSLDQKAPFDILTRTLIVNAQGCGVQTALEIAADTPVEIAVEDRVASGRILNSTLVDAERKVWVVGVELNEAGNFWGIQPPPADWIAPTETSPRPGPQPAGSAATKVHPFARKRAQKPAEPETGAAIAPLATQPAPAANAEELRGRFEELLEEFRGRLRAQAANDFEKWQIDATTALRQVQKELGSELAADADSWRRETQKALETLSGLIKNGEERARIAEAQRNEVQAIASTAQSEIASAIEQLQKASLRTASVDNNEEIARLRAELLSFETKAPALVEVLVKERTQQSMDAAGRRVEQELASALAAGLQQLQGRIREMSSAEESEIRRRLLADFVAQQEKFLAMSSAQLAEIRTRESSFRSAADDLIGQLSRHAEEAMANLRVHTEELVSRHESELALRFSERHDEIARRLDTESDRLNALQIAAEKALQAIDERQEAARKSEADLSRAADAALETIDQRHATAQKAIEQAATESLEKLTAGLETGRQSLEASLQQQAWDYQAQAEAASERLQGRLAAALHKLDADIEEKQATLSADFAADAGKALQAERERQASAFREEVEKERRQQGADFQQQKTEVAASMAELKQQREQVAAELAELQQTRRHLESLMAAFPDKVREQTQHAASNAWEDLRARSEKYLSETVQAEAQRGTTRVLEEINAAADRLREEMAAHAQLTASQLQAKLAEALQAAATAGEAVDQRVARAQHEVRQSVERESEAALASLRAGAARLEGVQASAEERAKALQEQLDGARQWLGEHTAEFQKTVHDAFLQAGGEIRGRVHAAVDSADEMILQKSRDAMAQVDAATARQAQTLAHQADEAQKRLTDVEAHAAASAEALLKSRLAETLELFRSDAARLAESALSRWQSAMDDTLRSIPDLLRGKLEKSEPQKDSTASGR